MTEFVIAAAFVLLPLFVFIPMFGKYIDMKHSAIQAARYQAWEYTVWYNDIDDRGILENFNSGDAGFIIPEKTQAETLNEARVRTMSRVGFYETDNPATAGAGAIRTVRGADMFEEYTPNTMWTDYRGLPLYTGVIDVDEDKTATDDDTPSIEIFGVDVGEWLYTLIDIVQIGFDAVSAIINLLDSFSRNNQSDGSVLPGAGEPFAGSAGFKAMNTDGYTRVNFDMMGAVYNNGVGMRESGELGRTAGDKSTYLLGFNAKAGVLADGWNAGGTAHTYLQVGGATPSTLVNELLNLPGLSEIWDLISFIAPELSRCDPGGPSEPPDPLIKSPLAAPEGHLWLGYVDGDVVHPDRLSVDGEDPDERLGAHACDDSGRCVWDDDVQALDPQLSHSPCTL